MLIDFRERGREGEREGEKHRLVTSHAHTNPQPRHVSRPGIKPGTFQVYRMTLQPTEPPQPGFI